VILRLLRGTAPIKAPESVRHPRAPRECLEAAASLRAGTASHRAHLCDVSKNGCKIFIAETCGTGDRVEIALEDCPAVEGTIRWCRDYKAGIQFARPLTDAELRAWKRTIRQGRGPRGNFWSELLGAAG
jgi:hypothetical protein